MTTKMKAEDYRALVLHLSSSVSIINRKCSEFVKAHPFIPDMTADDYKTELALESLAKTSNSLLNDFLKHFSIEE